MNDKTTVVYNLARMMEYISDINDIVNRAGSIEDAFFDKAYKHAINSCFIQMGEHAGKILKIQQKYD